jgi:nitroreductase
MELAQAIRERKSIRAFKSDPVPKDIIRELLEIAAHAPSSMNTQPWHITVVTGAALDTIRQGNLDMLTVAAPGPERPLEGRYRERRLELEQQLFALLGITRDNKEQRNELLKQRTRFYDAPAVIFLSIDETLGDRTPYFDCGLLTQTICLIALNYDLGTCILASGLRFPDVIRRVTGIPSSQRLLFSICLGYPDWTKPANRMESKRDPIDDIVKWVE